MFGRVLGLVFLACAVSACAGEGDDDATVTRDAGGLVRDGGTRDGGVSRDGGSQRDAGSARDGGVPYDAGLERDGGAPRDGGLEYDSNGCLTFAGASDFCGFDSGDRVCTFMVACGIASDLSQCKINCEMGTTVMCYGPDDVQCVIDAVSANACNDATTCGWIF